MIRFLLTAFAVTSALQAAPPDPVDRQRLVAHFEMTESWLVDEVSKLSPAQLHFQPSPTAWSILDCVEHLDLSETNYWRMMQEAMAAPASKKGSPTGDLNRIWYGIDRTEKAKTIPSETPKAKFAELAPALQDFRDRRAIMLQYILTSQEDWRHHIVPDWNRDGFQWLLMISAHSQRHILQIREIKHDPAFPNS